MYSRETRKLALKRYIMIGEDHKNFKTWRRLFLLYIKHFPHNEEDKLDMDPGFFLNVFIKNLMEFLKPIFESFCDRAFVWLNPKNKIKKPKKWTIENFDKIVEKSFIQNKKKFKDLTGFEELEDYQFFNYILQMTLSECELNQLIRNFTKSKIIEEQRAVISCAEQASKSQRKLLLYKILYSKCNVRDDSLLNEYRADLIKFNYIEDLTNENDIDGLLLFCSKLDEIIDKIKTAFNQLSPQN